MIKTNKITGGKTDQLKELVTLLDQSEIENYTALELNCLLKCVETGLSRMRDNLRAEANKEFQEMTENDFENQRWTIRNMATVVKYSPRASWEYPESIDRATAELKATMKKMQNDGTAVRHVPEIDPTKGYTFSVTPLK